MSFPCNSDIEGARDSSPLILIVLL